MLVRLIRVPAVVVLAVVLTGVPTVGRAAPHPSEVPPVQVPGARVVDVRDTNGGITRFTTIPSGSLFRRHGGTGAACTYVATSAGTTSDGQHVERGQTVESMRWIFLEGLPESIGEPTPIDPGLLRGPLSTAVRWFTVFCDSTLHAVGLIAVPARDPMLDPHRRLDSLYQALRLVRPVVYRNPVVDRWGGLITRYTTWLAVTPSAWAAQRSNAVRWRGWTMYLLAEPVALDVQVDFTPARDRPSPAFHGRVACIARGATFARDGRSVPAMPPLPAQATPGVNGNCRWTPPGPGSVRIQARITYRVTFWANAYTESLADYVWTSTAVTFRVGELAAVNTKG
jgi:hypothetical protein